MVTLLAQPRPCIVCELPIINPTRNQTIHTIGHCATVKAQMDREKAIQKRKDKQK